MKKIDLFKVFMSKNASNEVGKILNSGYIGQGPQVDKFEQALKSHFGHDYLCTVNSGTSGIHLALHLLKNPDKNKIGLHGAVTYDSIWPGLESEDEVLTCPMTCTATNWPILANNLNIKWVDIDPKNLNIDLDDLSRKISRKTKVIMLVHWGGYPVDLDAVKEIQKNAYSMYGFKPVVIEDAAHSFGSNYNGKLIGTHGNLTIYSLQAIKHITSIDGGILMSPHKYLNDRAKLIRWYGIDRENDRKDFRCEADINEWGFKFHMNDICATVGMENLKFFDEIVGTHKSNGRFYDENLTNVPGVTLLERKLNHDSSFWLYSLLVENRNGFFKHMKEHGIAVSQVHERNDKHSCVRKYISNLPNLEKTIGKLVSIPVGWWIGNEEREYIVDVIKKGW